MSDSVGRLEVGEHREMSDVADEQFGARVDGPAGSRSRSTCRSARSRLALSEARAGAPLVDPGRAVNVVALPGAEGPVHGGEVVLGGALGAEQWLGTAALGSFA